MILAGKEAEWLTDNPSPDAENTFLHESVHWWQTAMTGYGHSAWSLFRQATSYLIGEWVKATNDTPNSRRIPIQPLDLAAPKLRLAQARFSLPDPSALLSTVSVRPDADRLSWRVNPIIAVTDSDYILQGCDIIECQAHYLATEYSFRRFGGASGPIARDGLAPKYWTAFAWFTNEVGRDYTPLFSMVCDLALQTVWGGLPSSEDEWQKESPAWRFFKLTAVLARREVPVIDVSDLISNYIEVGDELLRKANLPTLVNVFAGAFERGEWRKPLMGLEQVMLDAMDFKRQHPWCNAYPWLQEDILEDLRLKFPPPAIQVEGKLSLFLPPSSDRLTGRDVGHEIAGEFLLQGLFSQILGVPPTGRMPIKGTMECGFSYYELANVCPHQIADNCPGWFYPKNGSPFPIGNYGEESELGCPLEKLLYLYGVAISDIEISGG